MSIGDYGSESFKRNPKGVLCTVEVGLLYRVSMTEQLHLRSGAKIGLLETLRRERLLATVAFSSW